MTARYGRKLDDNHRLLVNMLKLLGASVETIQGSAGTPDLVVRVFGVERLAEVKMPGEDLNESQHKWWGAWGRPPTILRTTRDCEVLVSDMRGVMTRSDVQVDPSDWERP